MLRVLVKVQEVDGDELVGETDPVSVDVDSDLAAIDLRDFVVDEMVS